MPRKKTGTIWTETLIVRLSEQQDDDLRKTAEALGMDVSNLVRLIFTEHLPAYMERAEGAAQRAEAARANVAKGAGPAKRTKRKPGAKAKATDSDDENVRHLDV
jgi:hypothetical protein